MELSVCVILIGNRRVRSVVMLFLVTMRVLCRMGRDVIVFIIFVICSVSVVFLSWVRRSSGHGRRQPGFVVVLGLVGVVCRAVLVLIVNGLPPRSRRYWWLLFSGTWAVVAVIRRILLISVVVPVLIPVLIPVWMCILIVLPVRPIPVHVSIRLTGQRMRASIDPAPVDPAINQRFTAHL